MNGQWLGSYSGTNSGLFVIDLDDAGKHYEGILFCFDNNPSLPKLGADLKVPKGKRVFTTRLRLLPLDPVTGHTMTPAAVSQKYSGVQVPSYADATLKIAANTIVINWTTDIGTNGSGTVTKSEGGKPSVMVPETNITTWSDFKEYASRLEPYRYAFRGHENNSWRLRTAFHRTGRASLHRFTNLDVNALHRHLSGLTAHRFNLEDRLDFAAFLHLVQHHGYPTPLLDWTHSPFIGAYFAFRHIRKGRSSSSQKARLLIFDWEQWNANYQRAETVVAPFLHLTLLQPLAINNPRVIPQQSISMLTNIGDLREVHPRQGNDGK